MISPWNEIPLLPIYQLTVISFNMWGQVAVQEAIPQSFALAVPLSSHTACWWTDYWKIFYPEPSFHFILSTSTLSMYKWLSKGSNYVFCQCGIRDYISSKNGLSVMVMNKVFQCNLAISVQAWTWNFWNASHVTRVTLYLHQFLKNNWERRFFSGNI